MCVGGVKEGCKTEDVVSCLLPSRGSLCGEGAWSLFSLYSANNKAASSKPASSIFHVHLPMLPSLVENHVNKSLSTLFAMIRHWSHRGCWAIVSGSFFTCPTRQWSIYLLLFFVCFISQLHFEQTHLLEQSIRDHGACRRDARVESSSRPRCRSRAAATLSLRHTSHSQRATRHSHIQSQSQQSQTPIQTSSSLTNTHYATRSSSSSSGPDYQFS